MRAILRLCYLSLRSRGGFATQYMKQKTEAPIACSLLISTRYEAKRTSLSLKISKRKQYANGALLKLAASYISSGGTYGKELNRLGVTSPILLTGKPISFPNILQRSLVFGKKP